MTTIVDKIMPIAVTLALWAAGTGKLPEIIRQIHIAQAKLLWESRASNWGSLLILK
jgi:hypothetical protein